MNAQQTRRTGPSAGRAALLALAASVFAASCGHLPRDPEGTLGHVRSGHLRVGLIESPPWVVRTTGEPSGVEVRLLRDLAAETGATPEWHWGGEERHMQALHEYALDVVAGGLTADTPWAKQVGLTRPYYEERLVVGVPASATLPAKLDGIQVAVPRGEALDTYVARLGATPVLVDDIAEAHGLAAGPEWRLLGMGMTASDRVLHTAGHVIAVPPGENGWLDGVDRFLIGRKAAIEPMLREATARAEARP
jgi:polar amino acid transport system substrate-binding protein